MTGLRIWTPAERASRGLEVAEQYRGGATVPEIAEALGRSYGFTYQLLRETGVQFRRRGPRPPRLLEAGC